MSTFDAGIGQIRGELNSYKKYNNNRRGHLPVLFGLNLVSRQALLFDWCTTAVIFFLVKPVIDPSGLLSMEASMRVDSQRIRPPGLLKMSVNID
jgi:hypothetical protein